MERINNLDFLKTNPNKYLIRFVTLMQDDQGYKYEAIGDYWLYSEKYDKWLFIEDGYRSDGATDAPDIHSNAWWWHDKACEKGEWEDGTKLSNWQASTILGDVLWHESNYYCRNRRNLVLCVKRKLESFYWKWFTFLFGGGQARKNGMIRVRNGKSKDCNFIT